MSPSVLFVLACTAYVIVAYFGFRHIIGPCYLRHGRLPWPASLFQLLLFGGFPALGLMTWWDTDLAIGRAGPVLVVAGIALCVGGLLAVVVSVVTFRSLGMWVGLDAGGLRTGGIYRLSRNPQIVGFEVFLIGFTFLWPTWHMAVFILVSALLLSFMVRTEEVHLRSVFGEAYEEYARVTPRYLWR